jgi:hypothetical protein
MKKNYPKAKANAVKQNRIKQFKAHAKFKHSVWQPELNETVAGEVVHANNYLLIKDENGFIVRFSDDMRKAPFFDDSGACVAQAGDFVAITFRGEGKYLVAVERRNPSEWWWTLAKDEFDIQRAFDDIARYGGSMVAGISTAQAIEYAARQQTAAVAR